MLLMLSVDASDESLELASLEDWLIEDPELRLCTITRKVATARPGDMGAIADVLVVALGSGGAGAALATSLSTWLHTRVNRVTLRLSTEKGEIEICADGTGDVTDQVRKIIGSSGVGAS